MAVDLTLYVAWDGPRAQYDTDDIIEVVPYAGSNLPPHPSAPWVHVHILNAPWSTVLEAKNFLLATDGEENPATPEDAVFQNWRKLRVDKDSIPQPVKNSLNRDRTYQFDWSAIADAKIYNKKLQRLMTVLDWPTE